MALIETTRNQLAKYEAAEARILEGGQAFTSEDGEMLKEASLATIVAEKKRLSTLLYQLETPRPPRRQYRVDV